MVIKGVGASSGSESSDNNEAANTSHQYPTSASPVGRNAKYILQPEAILDHRVAPEGKRWYLVKWKPRWVKKHELPEGVWEKWQQRKNGVGLDEPVQGLRIMEERRVPAGFNVEELNQMVNDEPEVKEEPCR